MSLHNMTESQKERLRQKFCMAIAEIWHRETGSVLPLSIEGTICITPSPGRTTAFQVSSQVPGKFPVVEEIYEDAHEASPKRRKVNEIGEWCSDEGFSGEIDEQLMLPRHSKSSSLCDSNNNQSEMMDAEIEPADSGRLLLDGHSNETSDQEIESSDAELSSDSLQHSLNAKEREQENQNDGNGINNDSGVHDMSIVEGNNSCLGTEMKSVNLSKSKDPAEGSEPAGRETDENRSTPPPLVIDLSSHESSQQPVLSLTANVQTAIRNMLSSKLVATSICKISDGKLGASVLPLAIAAAANATTPRLILQKTVQNDECPKTSLPAKHSTPISFVYPINGKQFIERPMQSILTIANPASGRSICVEPQPAKLELPLNISLQVANSSDTPSSSVKAEPGVEQSANSAEQKSYRCEYCQKTFLFKSKYQEHLPVHTTERPFECHMCQRTYKYKYDLNVHQRTHQGIPTKSTICPKCNLRFSTNKLLRVHINDVHRGDENIPKVNPEKTLEENLNDSVSISTDKEASMEPRSMKSDTIISTEDIH